MKTSKQLFNGRLYLEGLKRLRIVGLAMLILCMAICVIVPVSVWADSERGDVYATVMIDPVTGVVIDGEQNDGYVRPVKEMEDAILAIPALVASYLAPLFIFFMFSYLNKRNECDFYHAIPYTRGCVYISFSAAVLSWVFGILITSSLAAGLLWAICPYTTFSFVGLLKQICYMCLNAGMLMGITSVAVSLMGTFGTAAVAACVLLASWRVVMGLAGLYLDDVNYMLRFEDILGGYLSPNMLLPVHLITNEVEIERGGVLVYAAFVMIAAFALGGFLYTRRRSETAGRAVPAKWLQITVRCLLALPVALVLTYGIMSGNLDGSMLIVLLAVMLLAFYLYELLTSKSVRSMVRATPWLGAVLGVCILFGSALGLANYTVNNQHIDEDRIAAVGVDATRAPSGYGISHYEMLQIQDALTKDDEAVKIVAEALAKTQHAVRTDNYYFEYTGGDYVRYNTEYVYTRIKLNSGLTITRRLRFNSEDYRTLLDIVREEKHLSPVPVMGDVERINLQLMEGYHTVEVQRAQYRTLLATMREEYPAMTEGQRARFVSGDAWQSQSTGFVLSVRVERNRDMSYLSYAIMADAMPRTYALLETIAGDAFADTAEVTRLLDGLEAGGEDSPMELVVRMPTYEKTMYYGYYSAATFGEVIDFLRNHMKDIEPQSSEALSYVLIRGDNIKYDVSADMMNPNSYTPYVMEKGIDGYYYHDEMLFRLALSPAQQQELFQLLERAHKIAVGLIEPDDKK